MLLYFVDRRRSMHFAQSKQRTKHATLLILVGMAHLLLLWQVRLNHNNPTAQLNQDRQTSIIFIPNTVPKQIIPQAASKVPNKIQEQHRIKVSKLVSAPKTQKSQTQSEEVKPDNPILNRDIKALTQSLEREWTQEQRNIQAAKPPNQLVREYWEKQNNPYKNKWDALASKIEKAGVARGPQEESYTLEDGSRITKLNGICYKAPDPGRTYLNQPEARPVICPRN